MEIAGSDVVASLMSIATSASAVFVGVQACLARQLIERPEPSFAALFDQEFRDKETVHLTLYCSNLGSVPVVIHRVESRRLPGHQISVRASREKGPAGVVDASASLRGPRSINPSQVGEPDAKAEFEVWYGRTRASQAVG